MQKMFNLNIYTKRYKLSSFAINFNLNVFLYIPIFITLKNKRLKRFINKFSGWLAELTLLFIM